MTTSCLPRAFRFLAIAVLALTALGLRAASPATFDIPAQPAPAALKQFIKQSGTQVVYLQDDLKAVTTKAIKGELAPADALAQLLDGTGFTVETMPNGNFTISRQVAVKPGSIEGTIRDNESSRPVAGARVVIAGTDVSVVTDKRGRFTFAEAPAGEHALEIFADGIQNTKVTDVSVKAGHRLTLSPIGVPVKTAGAVELEPYVVSAKKNDGIIELDPYSVEGRKEKPFLANLDIPRTINDAQPYYVFDSNAIDASAAVNVEDFLKQRLTMNTLAQSNAQVSGLTNAGNTSTINLRGVGKDKTLVLVNGRRVAGVNIATSDNQPDVNGIPLSAIDRIEVLPTSASGIYGGSAIGGVVNVILKRNYVGGELRLVYDNTFDGDSPRRTASISYGMSLEGGRTHLMLNGSWADQKPLLFQDRLQIFEANLATIQQHAPTFIYSDTTPWLGKLPNIAGFEPLVLKSGNTPLNSTISFIPAGTSSSTSSSELAAGLLANAGRWNLEFPSSTLSPTGLLQPIGSTPKNRSFQASLRRQMTSRLELMADFAWNENNTTSSYYPIDRSVFVPAAALTNPFKSSVLVTVPDPREVPMNTRSENQSAAISALARLPWDWNGALDYSWSENSFEYQYSLLDDDGLAADILNGALNPFVDSSRFALNTGKYFRRVFYQGKNQLQTISFRGSGPLPSLPWGRPNLTLGLEHQIAHTPERSVVNSYPITTTASSLTKYYARETTSTSGYAEATIPLVREDWLKGLHSLDIQLSGRNERFDVSTGTPSETTRYNLTPPTVSYAAPTLNGAPYFADDSYTSTNYTMGVKYQPKNDVIIRISRATAFLPPTPAQLVQNPAPNASTTRVDDPVTGQLRVPVQVIAGGNPNLKPQSSESLNIGIIWEPDSGPLNGLRFNAEYYNISQSDAIGTLGAQGIVNLESEYPERVKRDGTGKITLVDNSMINLFRRETEGIDVSLSYITKTRIGQISVRGTGTALLHLKSQYALTQPEYDAAGYSPAEQGAPKYKASMSVGWEWKRWRTEWTTRYISSYNQYGATGGPYSKQFQNGGLYDFYIIAQGASAVSSQAYHDLVVSYSLNSPKASFTGDRNSAVRRGFFDGLTIQIGLRNVFDAAPPLDVFYSSNFYLSPYGDTRLRSYQLSARWQF